MRHGFCVNLSESSAPVLARTKAKRVRWPIEVKDGSVIAKVYRVWRPGLRRYVYNVVYYLGSERQVKQRGKLDVALDFARFQVAALAANKPTVAEATQHDLDVLAEARKRTGEVPVLLALGEWSKARQLVGSEIIVACEAWARRLTKFERISAFEAVEKFKTALLAKAAKRAKGDLAFEVKLPKSYAVVLRAFQTRFGDRYLDDLKKLELDEWFGAQGKSGWTQNTYRKRVVTLFHWARRANFLARDMVTEADQTERAEEEAPKRELTTPRTLARILLLLQEGIDVDHPNVKHEPRPELVPPVVLSAFSGYRSIEGHRQKWEDLDIEEEQGTVTKAKRGTITDRTTKLPACAIAWLKLTPKVERTGSLHEYQTEIHTIIRNHLMRCIGLTLPPNTLRKSWESYRYVLSHDDGEEAAVEAGHTTGVAAKHYRNPRAKKSDAEKWFDIFPDSLPDYLPMKAGHVGGSVDKAQGRAVA